MSLDEIRFKVVQDLINTGRYQPEDTKFLIDNAQEIVKYIWTGEGYGEASSEMKAMK